MIYTARIFRGKALYKPFAGATLDEQVGRLSRWPYSPGCFYHVIRKSKVSVAELQSILGQGLQGEEIWVSKDQPWREYTSGVCLELDLTGVAMYPDQRWVKEAGTFIVDNAISSDRILRVFDYIEKWHIREDVLAQHTYQMSSGALREKLQKLA